MTMAAEAPAAEAIQVAGGTTYYQRAGRGDPLVVIHDDFGLPGWLPFYQRLAESRTVYLPTLIGWGKSERPEWARDTRDIAIALRQTLTQLGLANVDVVGLGYGGWIAAEVATMSPETFRNIVLVGPAGLLPPKGEYLDQFMVHSIEHVRDGFHDQAKFDATFGEVPDLDRLEEWEINREMSTRIFWSPYFYSQTLPHLLGAVKNRTLLVYGNDDMIVPYSVVEEYARVLPNASIERVDNCGHYVDIEQPDALLKLIASFCTAKA